MPIRSALSAVAIAATVLTLPPMLPGATATAAVRTRLAMSALGDLTPIGEPAVAVGSRPRARARGRLGAGLPRRSLSARHCPGGLVEALATAVTATPPARVATAWISTRADRLRERLAARVRRFAPSHRRQGGRLP